MELFAAAGINLPSTGGAGKKVRVSPTLLRIPLLNYKVVNAARDLAGFIPTEDQTLAARDYVKTISNPKFLLQKETAVRPVFIAQILTRILGYTAIGPDDDYTLASEKPIRRGAVDVALGRFNENTNRSEIVAPFELKGPDTSDLDRIMPGRGRSPVQQAWDYANDIPGSRWVLVSNCLEIRLYANGSGREAFEHFDLRKLDDPLELERLWLILSATRFLNKKTDTLLKETGQALKDITNQLYSDYKQLRDRLIDFLVNTDEGKLKPLMAIEAAQKTLDRVLFIAFAQRRDLLPSTILERAVKATSEFDPKPIWSNFQGLFRWIDKGNFDKSIPAYNGGLFAPDAVVDALTIPDPLATDIAKLGEWDYRSEIPVTVLGHIFEQSITDIERLKAESIGAEPPDVSKSKRDGVVYTPDFVTRFLVEQTIIRTLDERLTALKLTHDMASEESEKALWTAYLTELRSLTILDPACGSGAFLVAAFDEMARQYLGVTERLVELGGAIDFDIFDEIVTKNLYGVDINAESVEISRLALWLKTARREHKLQNLTDTIKHGNSLVEDKAFTPHPFKWQKAFPEVFKAKNGGFDIVIGNPPYVRMELISDVKPYLDKNYVVGDSSADLYAYFFEKGINLLKPNGRLGYISSSTFFRTGSGEKLRTFLTDGVAVETVVDFGDLQLFEGVTTYPTILTAQKTKLQEGSLEFLKVQVEKPENLGVLFTEQAQPMPRSRLTSGSWRFEDEPMAQLRDKIVTGRKTLGEVYGAPMRGILTGLNEAFIIDTPTRDRLVKADPKSAELLKPFLRGENVKRWRVESDGLFLINIPHGWTKEKFKDETSEILAWKAFSKRHPALSSHLAFFKERAKIRTDQGQYWWELRACAYLKRFADCKIIYPVISQGPRFSFDLNGYNTNDKCYIFTGGHAELSYLNSKACWFWLFGETSPLRGGQWRLELREQHMSKLPIPDMPAPARIRLATLGEACTTAARERFTIQSSVQHRILDLAGPDKRKMTGKLENWHELSFAAFMAEIKKAFRADIPLKARAEWEAYLKENTAVVNAYSQTIAAAENEINQIVYGLFDLTPDEIALLEASLEGQY